MITRHLLMIGAHQRTTPVAIRERLACAADDLPARLAALGEVADEGFILSTCNRVEVYAVLEGPTADPRPLLDLLARHSGLPAEQIAAHVRILEGDDVARHAARLAAGMDSMVLGEDQIVGQLKAALAAAQEQGAVGQGLNRLLQTALAAGKAVRTQTGIARSRLSVVSVALDLARTALGGLAGRRALIVGAGQTGELALKHLRDYGRVEVTVANRTAARAEALAERYGATAIGLADVGAALLDADLAICCTASPACVIDAAMVARALEGRGGPLLLLDLAVPRDVDPEARGVDGATLYDVDDLQAICDDNRAARAGEIARADEIVDEAVAKFMEWWLARQATPTIRALREQAEQIRAAEVERALARLPELGEREQAAIQALSEAIVNKLLHRPIVHMKEPHGGDLIAAAQRLFEIETAGGADGRPEPLARSVGAAR